MNILVLHGPNLGSLGRREIEIYGEMTLPDLNEMLNRTALEKGVMLKTFQSNHEGELIDLIEKNVDTTDALIINAGGLTHTSIALMDAAKAYGKPVIEVHLTDPKEREEFRHVSYIGMVAEKCFSGKGVGSYLEALEYVSDKYK